jgi:O-antigen ligase
MNRFFCTLLIFFAILLFASSPAHAQPPAYPHGIKDPSDIVNGIYAADDAGSCCWVGTSAEIRVVAPPGADTLLLNVYLPDFSVKGGAQSLSVQIDDAPPVRRCCLGAGEHELTIPLPRAARHGTLTIKLWPARTFVPKQLGLNEDERQLSVMLRDVGFLDSVTGERLDTAPLPGLPTWAAVPVLLLCGVAVLMLTLRRPLFGLLALIATDPFLLAYSTHGTTVTLPKVALIAVAIGLAPRIVQITRVRPLRTLFVLGGAQLLFIATMLPGSVHAIFHGAALRETLKAVEYLVTIVVAYCAYRLDPSERALRIAVALITIVVTALAFAQLVLPVGETELIAGHDVARIGGPLEGPNQLAGFLGVVVPAMLAFVLLRRPFLLELIALPMGILACVMTFSRGGTAALFFAVTAMLAVRYFPAQRALVGFCAAALFGTVLVLAFGVFSGALHGGIQALFGLTGEGAFNGGLGSRVDLWHGAYAFWRSHPLFGIGPGNFELEVGRYFPGARTHANGIFFQVLAEQGIVGLIAALVLTAASVGAFVRRLDEPLVLGACMASVAMAFHQIVDCMWLYPKVTVMWWLVLASAAAVVDRRAEIAGALWPQV